MPAPADQRQSGQPHSSLTHSLMLQNGKPRPVISSTPPGVGYAQNFTFSYSNTSSLDRVVFHRVSSVTHGELAAPTWSRLCSPQLTAIVSFLACPSSGSTQALQQHPTQAACRGLLSAAPAVSLQADRTRCLAQPA